MEERSVAKSVEKVKFPLRLNLQAFNDLTGDSGNSEGQQSGAQNGSGLENNEGSQTNNKETNNGNHNQNKEGQTNQSGNSDNGSKNQTKNLFTQEDVNKIAAREAKKAQEKILKQLGVTDFESAREGLKKLKQMQEESMTETEKLQKQNEQLLNENNEYKEKVENLQAQLVALKENVNPESLEDVIALAKVKVNEDVTIEDAIKEVINKYPHFKRQQKEIKKPSFSNGQNKNDVEKPNEEELWKKAFDFGIWGSKK